MASKREISQMLEQEAEVSLKPELSEAMKKAKLRDLKNKIVKIIATENVNVLDISSIENITSIGVLEILLGDLKNETNIQK